MKLNTLKYLSKFVTRRFGTSELSTSIFLAFGTVTTAPAWAAIDMVATATLINSTAGAYADLSGLTASLPNGVAGNHLGGLGSGLAWAGGNTFLALPDRGPNATSYAGGAAVDNTTAYIARFQTVQMSLSPNVSATGLPFNLSATLIGTTLLSSPTALNYGVTTGLSSAIPSLNSASQNYFTGRSDGFAPGLSTNAANARLDPEGIRVSNDGRSVFVSDEYGPYVRQFDRSSGTLIRTFALPNSFAISNLNSLGASEISNNTSGRVTNKGMEGLAITPDGKTLVGFMQSPLLQDGGDGGRYNRIITIDISTGATKQFAYDNSIAGKNYNSSEILAVNDKQFLVLERDGKGLGDGTSALVKQIRLVDTTGAQDVSNIFGATNLASLALSPSLFLDLRAAFNAMGISDTNIPAKLEGLAFGNDIVMNGQIRHTLWVANDNDFVPDNAGPNRFFVFSFADTDLPGFQNQSIQAVPLPASLALFAPGLLYLVWRRKNRA